MVEKLRLSNSKSSLVSILRWKRLCVGSAVCRLTSVVFGYLEVMRVRMVGELLYRIVLLKMYVYRMFFDVILSNVML